MARSEKTMAKPEGQLIAVACRSATDGVMRTPSRPSRVPIAAIETALSSWTAEVPVSCLPLWSRSVSASGSPQNWA